MSRPRVSLLARVLRLDRLHRDRRKAERLDNHLRRDIGLAPHETPPRNPFTEGW